MPFNVPWHWAAPEVPAVVDCDMQQSAVCESLNVWPSVLMYDVMDDAATVVGTWYWCDDVWIGFRRSGQLGTVTDWLA